LKELVKSTLLGVYKYSGAMAAQEKMSYWAGRSFLPILLFHRVTDDIPPDGLTVSTAYFRSVCQLLHRRFQVVSLSQAMHFLEDDERLPPRTIAITFDDCYQDNLWAARTLVEYKLPACFFIPTAYPGTEHVFPWDQGLKPMANLTWDGIREIAELGHEIGSHSVHHEDMAQTTHDHARQELLASKEALEKHVGRAVKWFAYPFGGRQNFTPDLLPLVSEAGYRGCFSGFGGFAYPGMRGQIIPRVPVPCFKSLLNLELHLAGCLSWLYALKRKSGMIA
jgi:peptidoglycan/xylan/chitin deacetylase (PgdA/CDA1 family)